MDFQKWLAFLYLSSIALLAAAQPKLLYSLCDQTGNYEHNSTYHHNLNTLLSSISSKINDHGFYNASTGQNPDRASVTALCRGDVEPEKCRSCVDNAAREMVKVCPKEKGAFGGYDECMIRYSNEYSTVDSWSRFPQVYIDWLNGSTNASSQDRFNEDLRKLLDGLRDRAANGGDFLKFAGDNTTGPDLQSIYAVVQCSPELSATDCSDCLTSAFGDLSKCPCHGKRRGGIIRPSCNLRYENYSFFDYNKVMIESTPPRSVISIALPPNSRDFPVTHNYLNKYILESELDFAVFKALPPNSAQRVNFEISSTETRTHDLPSEGGHYMPIEHKVLGKYCLVMLRESNKNTIRIVIIIVVAVGVFIILTICVSILVLRKRQKRKQKNDNDSVDEVSVVEFLKYEFGTIKKATNNFSDSNKIGQGGFGPVYKGKLNGHDVAVKRLSRNSGQGDREFKNEVILVGQLQHRNLVRLLGFSLNKRERLLVYEFVPNASLDYFLFDPVKRALLDWNTRYKIISGISKGLLYLHEDSNIRIIHRDLKPSNVLLNAEMNPKISDFGMARLYDLDESHCSTSRIVGTYGYMAPEYAFHGQFSIKSDTFSFGVLVLEIISGQKSNCFRNGRSEQDLLSNAWTQWREGTALNLVDPILRGNNSSGSVQEMMKCIHMALLCVQENVADRPTMSTVVLMLSGSSLSLPLPSAPPFFMHSSITPRFRRSFQNRTQPCLNP
nr:putative receptor-like protein kinase At4g00960 [Ipomoea batatas]